MAAFVIRLKTPLNHFKAGISKQSLADKVTLLKMLEEQIWYEDNGLPEDRGVIFRSSEVRYKDSDYPTVNITLDELKAAITKLKPIPKTVLKKFVEERCWREDDGTTDPAEAELLVQSRADYKSGKYLKLVDVAKVQGDRAAIYKVIITRTAHRQSRKLPPKIRAEIASGIAALSETPTPEGGRKLAGAADEYFMWYDKYRLRYQVDEAQARVIIYICRSMKQFYQAVVFFDMVDEYGNSMMVS